MTTTQQLIEMQARLAANRRKKLPPEVTAKSLLDYQPEKFLHQQIIGECKRRGWLVFHGSMAHSTFRTPGEPDFVILAEGKSVSEPRTFLVECKSKTGKLSVDQRAVAAMAEKLGHRVHVVRSFAEFLEAVQPQLLTTEKPEMKTPKPRKTAVRCTGMFVPPSVDMRSPLAKARDQWLDSIDGKKCSDPLTLKTTADQRQYMENRLVSAFLAGANWLEREKQKRGRHNGL